MKSHLEFLKEVGSHYLKKEWKSRGKFGKAFFIWTLFFTFVYFPLVIGLNVVSNDPISKWTLIFWIGFAWVLVMFGWFKDILNEWELDRYRTKTDEIIFGAVKGIISEIVKRSGMGLEVNIEKGEDKKSDEKFN